MRVTILILDKLKQSVIVIGRQKAGRIYQVWPGGGLESSETLEAAALREVAEELDINLSTQQLTLLESSAEGAVFLAETDLAVGKLAISGEEKERSSRDNVYSPYWLSLDQLASLDVFPKIHVRAIKSKIRELK